MEVAHFFWKGEMTKLEIASIKSFVKNGFNVYMWSYENHQIEGAISMDANSIINNDSVSIQMNSESFGPSPIPAFSDLFRYNVLSKYGGWWFDCDCICLKNQSYFKNLREGIGKNKMLVGMHDAGNNTLMATNAVMYLSKEIAHDLLIESNIVLDKYGWVLPKWGLIGPTLVQKYIEHNNLLHHAVPYNYFFEIEYNSVSDFYNPIMFKSSMRRIKNSYVTHVWDSYLKHNNIDKNNPPENTLLYFLINSNI